MKTFNPYTPSRRFISVEDFSQLSKKEPEKRLMRPIRKKAGRNNFGLLVVRHQGGGHKRAYRLIDFKRDKVGVPGKVATLEYDPNRSARIALLVYAIERAQSGILLRHYKDDLSAEGGCPEFRGASLFVKRHLPLLSKMLVRCGFRRRA